MKFKAKKYCAAALAAALLMGMSLTACDSQSANTETNETVQENNEADTNAEVKTDSADEAMSSEDYLAQVQNINSITKEWSEAMVKWSQNSMSDPSSAASGIEDLRAITDKYNDFIAITNPAEGFEDVHKELVDSLKLYCEDLDKYYAMLTDTCNGKEPSTEETESIQQSMKAHIEALGNAMGKAEALK